MPLLCLPGSSYSSNSQTPQQAGPALLSVHIIDEPTHLLANLQPNPPRALQPQVGGNGAGLADGSFEAAAFNRPQGLAYAASTGLLYVADTESHALREIDLKARSVRTLAGELAPGACWGANGQAHWAQGHVACNPAPVSVIALLPAQDSLH